MEIQDTGFPFAANIPVDGISTVFDLPVESISSEANPPTVVLGGTIISGQATPPYVFDYKHGVIAFYSPPGPAGAILGVQGTTYDFFDDDEVAQAVDDAFNLHVADQDPLPVIDPIPGQPSIDTSEEYLVSILAAIELLWFRANDASQIIDINTPEGVHINRAQRYAQITQQINNLQQQYQKIGGALGVGLYRIQILNQRRVSYTTNRLVPIFREQEYNQPYTSFAPTTGAVGALITLSGRYFTSATQVTFGGVPSQSFTIVSDCEITAIVPPGALTGQIGVLTPYGIVLSTAQFVVGEPPPFLLYGPELLHIPVPPGK